MTGDLPACLNLFLFWCQIFQIIITLDMLELKYFYSCSIMLDDVGVYKGNELNRNLRCLLLPEKATFTINMFKKCLMQLDIV